MVANLVEFISFVFDLVSNEMKFFQHTMHIDKQKCIQLSKNNFKYPLLMKDGCLHQIFYLLGFWTKNASILNLFHRQQGAKSKLGEQCPPVPH